MTFRAASKALINRPDSSRFQLRADAYAFWAVKQYQSQAMPSKHDPAKDHSHYGEDVRLALLAFQSAWASYEAMTWLQMRENPARIDSIQTAWNILIRARKAETGTGFYLNRQQYEALQR